MSRLIKPAFVALTFAVTALPHAIAANEGAGVLVYGVAGSGGLGALGILLLHVKSFFSTDVAELGFYYTRLYGLCFGFTCTSMVFLIILSFGEKSISTTSLFILMIAVFGIGFFNFFRDNYSDMAKKHLLAKELIEKNNKD